MDDAITIAKVKNNGNVLDQKMTFASSDIQYEHDHVQHSINI